MEESFLSIFVFCILLILLVEELFGVCLVHVAQIKELLWCYFKNYSSFF